MNRFSIAASIVFASLAVSNQSMAQIRVGAASSIRLSSAASASSVGRAVHASTGAGATAGGSTTGSGAVGSTGSSTAAPSGGGIVTTGSSTAAPSSGGIVSTGSSTGAPSNGNGVVNSTHFTPAPNPIPFPVLPAPAGVTPLSGKANVTGSASAIAKPKN